MAGRCAECGRSVRKQPVTVNVAGRSVRTYGPTCARRLGLLPHRQMAIKSPTSANTAARRRAANARQTTYPYGDAMAGQLQLFTVDERESDRG